MNVLEVGASIDGASKIKFGFFVAEGVLGHSLMEGAIAIEQNDLGPVREDVLGGVG
jgi:hypothetical protein